jgi:hypothetical protein
MSDQYALFPWNIDDGIGTRFRFGRGFAQIFGPRGLGLGSGLLTSVLDAKY